MLMRGGWAVSRGSLQHAPVTSARPSSSSLRRNAKARVTQNPARNLHHDDSRWPFEEINLQLQDRMWGPFRVLPVLLSDCILQFNWQEKYSVLERIFRATMHNHNKLESATMDADDFRAVLRTYPCTELARIRVLFSYLDCERRGRIRDIDFISGMLASSPQAPQLLPKRPAARRTPARTPSHAEQQQAVTTTEARTGIPPLTLMRLQLIFLSSDVDGDGLLDVSELSRLLRQAITALVDAKRTGRLMMPDEVAADPWSSFNAPIGPTFYACVVPNCTVPRGSGVMGISTTSAAGFGTVGDFVNRATQDATQFSAIRQFLGPATQRFTDFVGSSLKALMFGEDPKTAGPPKPGAASPPRIATSPRHTAKHRSSTTLVRANSVLDTDVRHGVAPRTTTARHEAAVHPDGDCVGRQHVNDVACDPATGGAPYRPQPVQSIPVGPTTGQGVSPDRETRRRRENANASSSIPSLLTDAIRTTTPTLDHSAPCRHLSPLVAAPDEKNNRTRIPPLRLNAWMDTPPGFKSAPAETEAPAEEEETLFPTTGVSTLAATVPDPASGSREATTSDAGFVLYAADMYPALRTPPRGAVSHDDRPMASSDDHGTHQAMPSPRRPTLVTEPIHGASPSVIVFRGGGGRCGSHETQGDTGVGWKGLGDRFLHRRHADPGQRRHHHDVASNRLSFDSALPSVASTGRAGSCNACRITTTDTSSFASSASSGGEEHTKPLTQTHQRRAAHRVLRTTSRGACLSARSQLRSTTSAALARHHHRHQSEATVGVTGRQSRDVSNTQDQGRSSFSSYVAMAAEQKTTQGCQHMESRVESNHLSSPPATTFTRQAEEEGRKTGRSSWCDFSQKTGQGHDATFDGLGGTPVPAKGERDPTLLLLRLVPADLMQYWRDALCNIIAARLIDVYGINGRGLSFCGFLQVKP